MDDLTGRRLNDYQLLRQLGRGAMAAVYLAEQQSLARRVAVKVLAEDFCRDQAYVDRFQHEARAAASLVHPGIVQVFEVGAVDVEGVRRHYIAQEYVAGGNLAREMQRSGVLEPGRVLEVLWQVGVALATAAERGLVHRDIKPDNLMLDRSGAVKVADFGLARLVASDGPRMTQAGVAMGTPLYMSPEQIEGREVDARSDLYSLGVTAYQLLTGDPPFTGETPLSVAVQHLNNAPDPVQKRRPNTPAALGQVIDRLLAKAPEERFESPGTLLQTLAAVAQAGQADGWVSSSGVGGSGVGVTTMAAAWTPQSSDDRVALSRLADAMRGESAHAKRGRSGRRSKAAWLLGGLAVGGFLGAAIAPAALLRPRAIAIERFDTVKQQLFHAKTVETPAAWSAVLDYHEDADGFYRTLGLRGLALCCLQRGQDQRAIDALERLPEASSDDEEAGLLTAAARVVAYGRIGRDDAARTSGGLLLATPAPQRERAARLAPDLFEECEAVLRRLN